VFIAPRQLFIENLIITTSLPCLLLILPVEGVKSTTRNVFHRHLHPKGKGGWGWERQFLINVVTVCSNVKQYMESLKETSDDSPEGVE
jgi:hypothetical protein